MSFACRVQPVAEKDFPAFFAVAASAFGHQAHDAIWCSFNPSWDTPEGSKQGADRLRDRWAARAQNINGQDNTVFLKAIAQDGGENGQEFIAGVAIWQQLSDVPGHGDRVHEGPEQRAILNAKALWPNDPLMQKFLEQSDASLHAARVRTIREIKDRAPPAAFVLDLCAVHPSFQRRGIAQALVREGLDEARRRGGLECLTEASVMGRKVYQRLGFVEVEQVDYRLDEDLKNRPMPGNVFMRTDPPSSIRLMSTEG